ncbi:MAG: hypothetical protein U0X20_24895 [Caldilineaceae bacterium]
MIEPWRQIKELRDAGRCQEALTLGTELRAQEPNDFRLKSQIEWSYYCLARQAVQEIEQSLDQTTPIRRADIESLHTSLREYARLKPKKPEMVLSNLLHQLSKVGRHLDWYLEFLAWCGDEPFRPEDLKSSVYNDHAIPSWALSTAREAAAWIKARPQASDEQVTKTLLLAQNVYDRCEDKDKTWLEWDLAHLLRRAGQVQPAAEFLVRVLKQKRTDYWVWAEAARLYCEEQPDLALACYCQALKLGAEPEKLVKVHRELAELLADMGNSAQASDELALVGKIYDQNGWRLKPEIVGLMQTDWYDPTLPAQEPAKFYADHADEALTLCFDEVRELPATYLGMTEPRDDKKPRPRFAVTLADSPVSMLGRRGARLLHSLPAGSPVSLLIGIEGQRTDILDVLPRADGTAWDCTTSREGVISWCAGADSFMKVYCARDDELRVPLKVWLDSAQPAPGKGVRLHGALNPANSRFDVACAQPIDRPIAADIGLFQGQLQRKDSGIGFVNNVFVPLYLLDEQIQNGAECEVVAVQSFDNKKQVHNWRAVALRVCH